MSRIEMAMEKAARLRAGDSSATPHLPPPHEPPKAQHRPPQPVARAVNPRNPFLVNLLDPHSPPAEEYNKLKSALVNMTQDPFRNAILITSAVPGEGKSLTALNLAISLAQGLDHTVLLIDGDLRRPSLHSYLEMEQGVGLADVLMEEATIGDTIVPTGIGKLSVIRGGRQVDNPVELFTSQKMKGLVEELKRRYPDRYVIFDSPPLLPFAEGRSLAQMVDGVLFVAMEGLASQIKMHEALESIKGAPLLGIVYNGATADVARDHYGYYRRYAKSE